MVSPINNPIDFYNLFFLLIISILFSILDLTTFKKYGNMFISIITPLTQSLNAIYKSDIMTEFTNDSRVVSDKKIFLLLVSVDYQVV